MLTEIVAYPEGEDEIKEKLVEKVEKVSEELVQKASDTSSELDKIIEIIEQLREELKNNDQS